jgi:hypothetical protein
MSKHLVFEAHVTPRKCSLIDDSIGAKITGKYRRACNFCDNFFQTSIHVILETEQRFVSVDIFCRGIEWLDTAFWHSTLA